MQLFCLVVEPIHQVDSLKQNCFVFNVQLCSNLEKPVDDGCAQLTSDVWLVGHQRTELLLMLTCSHVLKLFTTVALQVNRLIRSKKFAVGRLQLS